jgi:cytochrome b561
MHRGAARLCAIILARTDRAGARGTTPVDSLFAVELQRTVRAQRAMAMDKTGGRYGGAAIALHWLTAVLVVANLMLGLSMVPLPIIPRKLQWYAWHKWIGITVFLLTCVRLGWRWVQPAPPPVAMPEWQRRAAEVTQVLMYALLLVIPISGWLYSSATGVQVVYLGLVPLPNLVPNDKALASVLKGAHVALNFTLFTLVFVHTAAALKHHFVDRDPALMRMLPRTGPKGSVG